MESITTERLAVTGVSHIEFHVTDLDASIAWYGRVVSFTPLKSRAGRRVPARSSERRLQARLERPIPLMCGRFGHLAIALESMDVLRGWVKHLDLMGTPHTPIKENPYQPGVFSIDVFDLDGHEIELIFEP